MTRHHDDPLLTEAHAVEALFKSKVAANISIAMSRGLRFGNSPVREGADANVQARTALGPDAFATSVEPRLVELIGGHEDFLPQV